MANKYVISILVLIMIETGLSVNDTHYIDTSSLKSIPGDDDLISEEDIQESPIYEVSIHFDNEHICGGTVLSYQVIITGAFCIEQFFRGSVVKNPENIFVVAGKTNKTKVEVQEIAVHPEYDNYIEHDVAVLFLKQTLNYTESLGPICLPKSNVDITKGMLTDWIVTIQNKLRTGETVNIEITITNCSCASFVNFELDGFFCAKDSRYYGREKCSVRSGSPLVVNNTLYGIAAAGISCNEYCNLRIFTNIWKNLDWIENTTEEWKLSAESKEIFHSLLKVYICTIGVCFIFVLGVVMLVLAFNRSYFRKSNQPNYNYEQYINGYDGDIDINVEMASYERPLV